jgi:hypothetical protein
MSGEEVKEVVSGGVVAEVQPSVEDRISSLEVSVRALESRVQVLAEAVPSVEFSKEDRDTITRAFSDVHKALGVAFTTLSQKDIGYVAEFDSKRGVLRVRLFKALE